MLDAQSAAGSLEIANPEPYPGDDALFAPPQAAANGKVVFSLVEGPVAVPSHKQSKWSPVHVWRPQAC